MSDDIIVTLRQEYEYFNAGKGGDYEAILQAIDEIERLNKELAEMRLVVISEHRRWCDRPCNAEEWNMHD